MKNLITLLCGLFLFGVVAAQQVSFDLKKDYSPTVQMSVSVSPATVQIQYAQNNLVQEWTVARAGDYQINLMNGDILLVKDEFGKLIIQEVNPWRSSYQEEITLRPTNENLSDIALLDLSGEGSMGDF